MSNQAVNVEILGKLTRVSCPSGQEDSLIEAAKDLDNRLKEMIKRTKVTNEVQLLTFAALNVCYELQENNKIKERIKLLAKSLENALCKVNLAQ
ncbi:cell division protein ZapA [Candidatus Photodesmus katoptron]|uniref:Cell division protein ZapA n=1 Tax=Candidatus Photodesmus katoptron Akat1 TaxID=1236703 RepID=S3DI07_9GAMM|nr:cell division protein ZapA [Candidatus Photodesmus katoptron]EPE37310.1 cell division protein ZapA [Candidatus Photodesmus katoptron Akat1]KEY90019.1 cell division protein ZapA [Candidatus Photodesmus katoptron]